MDSAQLKLLLNVDSFEGFDFASSLKDRPDLLSGVDFKYENFSWSDLSGLDLSRSHLFESNFIGANLTGANLTGTNLCYAQFTYANLSEVKLTQVEASLAKFVGAYCKFADLSNSKFNLSNFSQAKLCGADLRNSSFELCDFSGSDLSGADLRGANLTNANFVNCKFDCAIIFDNPIDFDNLRKNLLDYVNLQINPYDRDTKYHGGRSKFSLPLKTSELIGCPGDTGKGLIVFSLAFPKFDLKFLFEDIWDTLDIKRALNKSVE